MYGGVYKCWHCGGLIIFRIHDRTGDRYPIHLEGGCHPYRRKADPLIRRRTPIDLNDAYWVDSGSLCLRVACNCGHPNLTLYRNEAGEYQLLPPAGRKLTPHECWQKMSREQRDAFAAFHVRELKKTILRGTVSAATPSRPSGIANGRQVEIVGHLYWANREIETIELREGEMLVRAPLHTSANNLCDILIPVELYPYLELFPVISLRCEALHRGGSLYAFVPHTFQVFTSLRSVPPRAVPCSPSELATASFKEHSLSHADFWREYEPLRNRVLQVVTREGDQGEASKRLTSLGEGARPAEVGGMEEFREVALRRKLSALDQAVLDIHLQEKASEAPPTKSLIARIISFFR